MHRVLFTLHLPFIGPLDIYTYGVMLVLGFIFALTWTLRYSKPSDIEPETVLDLSICILITGIIGARLLFVLMNYQQFTNDIIGIFNLRRGGLAWYGAVLAAILGGFIFTKIYKLNFWKVADMFAPSIMMGLAIGRLGCFFNGCCYGTITNLPWGVEFPDTYPPGVERHPTQIYEAILDIAVFYILNRIDKKKKFQGKTFCYFIGLYALLRFIVEFFREWSTPTIPLFMGLNLAQETSIALIIIITIIGIILSRKKAIKKQPVIIEDDNKDLNDEIM